MPSLLPKSGGSTIFCIGANYIDNNGTRTTKFLKKAGDFCIPSDVLVDTFSAESEVGVS